MTSIRKFVRFAILVSVAFWPRTGFADQQVRADFDGDGKLDHAQMHASGVVVWLSETHVFSALRGADRPLQLIAVDLDRDGHPELVALDRAKGLRVWKAHKSGKLLPYKPRAPASGPALGRSPALTDGLPESEARESAAPRELSPPIIAVRDPVNTQTTRSLPSPPDRDPRTSSSRSIAPRAPPTPAI